MDIKVCFLLSGATYGGAESVVFQLASALDKSNLICIVFAKGTLYDHLKKLGIKIFYLDESKHSHLQLIINIRKILINENICIVHSHCIKESIIAGLATIGTKTKNIATVHGADEFSSTKVIRRIYNCIKQEVQHLIFSLRYEAIVLVSPSLIKDFHRYRNRKKIIIIRNGILGKKKERFTGRKLLKDLGVDCNRFTVGIVGRICKVKNQEYLVDLIKNNNKKLEDIEFLFVGEGAQLSVLKRRAKRIDNIIFLGFRPDILRIVSCFDLLVNTSLREGNPITLIEALMLKIPILASNVPGNKEVITDNYNGILFDLEKPEEFLEKLIQIKNDPKLRVSISKNGYLTYSNEYAIDIMIEKYSKVYKQDINES